MTTRLRLAFAAAVLVMIGVSAPAGATPVLEITSGLALATGGDLALGWSFTTNNAITIVALDVFDPAGTGFVQLYDAGGTVLASATVTNTDPIEGAPISFFSHAISPVSLAANTTYYITQDTLSGVTTAETFASGLVTASDITYGGAIIGLAGQKPTTDGAGGAYGDAWFGPNFDIAIPEPASLTLVGLGLAGLAAIRRRKAA